jgi:ABC-type multidrug transport system ATPase subunit
MGKQKQQSLRVTTQDIQVLTLARFRFGRVLLHLLAMLGDRCVRFHIAGITRELGRGSTNDVRRGSIFALMGGSGAGKSTLLRSM